MRVSIILGICVLVATMALGDKGAEEGDAYEEEPESDEDEVEAGDIIFGRPRPGQRLLGKAEVRETEADAKRSDTTFEKHRRVVATGRVITQIVVRPCGDQLPIVWMRSGGPGKSRAELGFILDQGSGIVYELKVYGVDERKSHRTGKD